MYRRVNSGRFIAVATVGIVIVMAVFTWVMYGMAQRVFLMTDVIIEMNQSMKAMVGTQVSMADDMHTMALNIKDMNGNFSEMNTNVAALSDNMVEMTKSVRSMTMNVNRMTHDIGQASYAFSQPMSYMWGGMLPF